MFKKTLLSVLLVMVVFFISLKLSSKVEDGFLFITDGIKNSVIDGQIFLVDSISRHFDQERQISELKFQSKENERLNLELLDKSVALENMMEELNAPRQNKEEYEMIKTISYVNLGDYNKIWLDYKMKDQNTIIGLVQKGFAAGIMINKNGRALGLLNGDTKCSYAVYIGENKVPGMLIGRGDEEKIYIEFIPSWKDVNINDEVVTSGLDGVFSEGIRIGYVESIEESQGYKVAKINSYADTLHPRFFWIKREYSKEKEENNITE